jgi:hypothetical protein
LSTAEKAAYATLQRAVRVKYDTLKAGCNASHYGISSKTLQAMALLLPLRQACSATDDMLKLCPSVDVAAEGGAETPKAAPEAADGADSTTECSICLEVLEDPCRTPCGHTYCFECISASLHRGANDAQSCPQCRKSCTAEQLIRVTLAAPAATEGGAGGSSAAAAEASVAAGAAVPMMAKWKVLKEQLEMIRDDDGSSKSLVFSQFTSTIEWLKQKLTSIGLQYRTLSGDMSLVRLFFRRVCDRACFCACFSCALSRIPNSFHPPPSHHHPTPVYSLVVSYRRHGPKR